LLAEVGRKVSLTELDISHCDAVTAEGCSRLAGLRALKSLDISGCKVTNAWLATLARLPALERLTLRMGAHVTDVDLAELAGGGEGGGRGSNSGSGDSGTAAAGLSAATAGMAAAGATATGLTGTLRHLCLSGCAEVTDAGLACLVPLRQLTSLDLSNLPRVTDAGVAALCARLPALQSLSVAGNPTVGNRTFQAAAHGCRGLTELDAHGTSADERGLQMLRGMPALQRLQLPRQGRGLGAEAVRHLAAIPALTALDLAGLGTKLAAALMPADLAPLAALGRLQTLSLCGVTAATDDALAALLPALPRLQQLDLNGAPCSSAAAMAGLSSLHDLGLAFTAFADDALEGLAAVPALTALTLRGCRGVGSRGLPYLGRLQHLRTLNLMGTDAAE
ncbi:unnamed protein product, partial [Phaeothamnion confervicola]